VVADKIGIQIVECGAHFADMALIDAKDDDFGEPSDFFRKLEK